MTPGIVCGRTLLAPIILRLLVVTTNLRQIAVWSLVKWASALPAGEPLHFFFSASSLSSSCHFEPHTLHISSLWARRASTSSSPKGRA